MDDEEEQQETKRQREVIDLLARAIIRLHESEQRAAGHGPPRRHRHRSPPARTKPRPDHGPDDQDDSSKQPDIVNRG